MPQKLNILHTVEYYYPSVGGAQEAVRQISEGLVKKGHTVTVATTFLPNRTSTVHNGVKIVDFAIRGNSINGLSGDIQKYKKFLRNSKFDIIMNYAAQQWATDIFLDILNEVKAKKVFVPCGFSGLYDIAYADYFKRMPAILKKYDSLVFLSDSYRDIKFARDNNIQNIQLIPNGASAEEFLNDSKIDIRKKLGIPSNNLLIILIGSHTNNKGHKEAIEIFKHAKITNATFLIIAEHSQKGCEKECQKKAFWLNIFNILSHNKKTIVTSLSRNDTVSILKTADLMLFPSNIECSPIVLFEAMASKTPFMVTDVGNSKEIIKWSKSGVLLPTNHLDGYSYADTVQSAILLEELIGNSKKRQTMANEGYNAWKDKFTWNHIVDQYEKLYESLV